MENFFASSLAWEEGVAWPHVYVSPRLEGQPRLSRLLSQGRRVLETGFSDCVAPVPDAWLHWTVARTARPDIDRADLVTRVRHAVQGIADFPVRVGSIVALSSVVLADTHDLDGGFASLRDCCTAAIGDVWGGDASGAPPHLSIGYGTAEGDTGDQLSTQLWLACQPPHALARIDAVTVADVYCDHTRGQFYWDTLASIRLA